MLRLLGALEHQGKGDMAASIFTSTLTDLYGGVIGIIRKRARHRCSKRGQNWDEYEKSVKGAQRVIGRARTKELMSKLVCQENPFLIMVSKSDFCGQYYPIPVEYNFTRRKRSKLRKLKGDKK